MFFGRLSRLSVFLFARVLDSERCDESVEWTTAFVRENLKTSFTVYAAIFLVMLLCKYFLVFVSILSAFPYNQLYMFKCKLKFFIFQFENDRRMVETSLFCYVNCFSETRLNMRSIDTECASRNLVVNLIYFLLLITFVHNFRMIFDNIEKSGPHQTIIKRFRNPYPMLCPIFVYIRQLNLFGIFYTFMETCRSAPTLTCKGRWTERNLETNL